MLNIQHTGFGRLALASSNPLPCNAEHPRLERSELRLHVNAAYSKTRIQGAKQLASYLESEFRRLSNNCSFSKAVSIKLDAIPEQKDLEIVCALLSSAGYFVEPQLHEPQLKTGEKSMTIFLELRSAKLN